MNSICINGINHTQEEILAGKNLKLLSPELIDFLRDWFSEAPVFHVRTSGSTGIPKQIPILKKHAVNSAKATCSYLGLKRGDNALLCLSTQYIAGKMMIVRAITTGLNLWTVPVDGHPMKSFLNSPHPHFHFAAMVPLQVINSLQTKDERNLLAQIDKIIIGGAPIDPQLETDLRPFPNTFLSTYGMTETLSHIAMRSLNGPQASPYYTTLPGVRIQTDIDETLTIDFPDIGVTQLKTHDRCQIVSRDRAQNFKILGRIDNIINSGGLKIQPEEIETKLTFLHPNHYAVTSLPHPVLSEAVVLLISTQSFQNQLDSANTKILKRQNWQNASERSDFLKLLSLHLTKYHLPKAIGWVDVLPFTPNGKIDRIALKQLAFKVFGENPFNPKSSLEIQKSFKTTNNILNNNDLL
ncbi:MAG: AMP-binding protein [Verrucomicrobia bacterium]|nr:AMP-binding protein [Verrucomicrobiota bacterium]